MAAGTSSPETNRPLQPSRTAWAFVCLPIRRPGNTRTRAPSWCSTPEGKVSRYLRHRIPASRDNCDAPWSRPRKAASALLLTDLALFALLSCKSAHRKLRPRDHAGHPHRGVRDGGGAGQSVGAMIPARPARREKQTEVATHGAPLLFVHRRRCVESRARGGLDFLGAHGAVRRGDAAHFRAHRGVRVSAIGADRASRVPRKGWSGRILSTSLEIGWAMVLPFRRSFSRSLRGRRTSFSGCPNRPRMP